MRDFRTLEIWKQSRQLAVEVYGLTRSFPKEEVFGLTSQLQRAVVSVGANIAEGCGRNSNADFQRFLTIALGSLNEAEYLLILSNDLHYCDDEKYRKLMRDIDKLKPMMMAFISKLREFVAEQKLAKGKGKKPNAHSL